MRQKEVQGETRDQKRREQKEIEDGRDREERKMDGWMNG